MGDRQERPDRLELTSNLAVTTPLLLAASLPTDTDIDPLVATDREVTVVTPSPIALPPLPPAAPRTVPAAPQRPPRTPESPITDVTEPLLAIDEALQVEDLEAHTEEDKRRWWEFAYERNIGVLAVQNTTNPHTPLLTDSYLVVHDGTMTWDIPGSEQLAGIHVRRDLGAGTFRLEYQRAPIVALAQNWLVSRGADLGQVTPHDERLPTCDQPSRALEQRLAQAGDRYWIANSYTSDLVLDPAHSSGGPPSSNEDLVYDFNTWVIAEDQRPAAGEHPVRVFYEDVDYLGRTYTLREGGFPDLDAAYEWTRRAGAPDNPLPPVGVESARSAAARATSPATAASPAAAVAPAPPTTNDQTVTRPRTR
ncbi:hypothetical protein [Kitasatospora aureofaciens]|uniref:hypothetical protein n=1 Tax=Kitasatospora aureofaciens TaxID=1894 RepID=UPI0033C017E1